MKVTFGCNEGDIARHFLNVLRLPKIYTRRSILHNKTVPAQNAVDRHNDAGFFSGFQGLGDKAPQQAFAKLTKIVLLNTVLKSGVRAKKSYI